jgi:hypothetical protein
MLCYRFGLLVLAALVLAAGPRGLKAADQPGKDIVTTAVEAGSFKTLATVLQAAGKATVNAAVLESTDIDASNGVIHVIDTVLLPPAPPGKECAGRSVNLAPDFLYLSAGRPSYDIQDASNASPIEQSRGYRVSTICKRILTESAPGSKLSASFNFIRSS